MNRLRSLAAIALALAMISSVALGAESSSAPVNVNTASEAEIQALPGIGKKTAAKIISNRPYGSAADLSKAGLSEKKIQKIAPLMTFEGGAAAPAAAASSAAESAPSPAAASSSAAKSKSHRKAKSAEAAASPEASSAPAPIASTGGEAEPVAAQTPPSPGMVWATPKSKIYHVEGDRYYGKTKHGQWMTEADAIKEGYRKSKVNVSGN